MRITKVKKNELIELGDIIENKETAKKYLVGYLDRDIDYAALICLRTFEIEELITFENIGNKSEKNLDNEIRKFLNLNKIDFILYKKNNNEIILG